MSRQGTGFGHFPFGHFPFGKTNFGFDVIRRSLPDTLLVDEDGNENVLLAHYLQTVEDSVNRIKSQIDKVEDQIDVDKIREDLLQFLGSTIDVSIDNSEPEDVKRSLISNAVQYYRIKGTDASYKIRGKISGFDVTVSNLYRIGPDIVSSFPSDDLIEIPPLSGNYYTILPPGSVSGTPTELGCDYCFTSFIKLNFEVVKAQPASVVGEGNFFDRIIFKLREIIPIHVRDVLFELSATIIVDANEQTATVSSFETTFMPVGFNYRFDLFAADSLPCDFHGSVSGLTTEVTI